MWSNEFSLIAEIENSGEVNSTEAVRSLLRSLVEVSSTSPHGEARRRTVDRVLWIKAYAAAARARDGDVHAGICSVRSGTREWSALFRAIPLHEIPEELEREFVTLVLGGDQMVASRCHKQWSRVEALTIAPLSRETAEQLTQAEAAWKEAWTEELQSFS